MVTILVWLYRTTVIVFVWEFDDCGRRRFLKRVGMLHKPGVDVLKTSDGGAPLATGRRCLSHATPRYSGILVPLLCVTSFRRYTPIGYYFQMVRCALNPGTVVLVPVWSPCICKS